MKSIKKTKYYNKKNKTRLVDLLNLQISTLTKPTGLTTF